MIPLGDAIPRQIYCDKMLAVAWLLALGNERTPTLLNRDQAFVTQQLERPERCVARHRVGVGNLGHARDLLSWLHGLDLFTQISSYAPVRRCGLSPLILHVISFTSQVTRALCSIP